MMGVGVWHDLAGGATKSSNHPQNEKGGKYDNGKHTRLAIQIPKILKVFEDVGIV